MDEKTEKDLESAFMILKGICPECFNSLALHDKPGSVHNTAGYPKKLSLCPNDFVVVATEDCAAQELLVRIMVNDGTSYNHSHPPLQKLDFIFPIEISDTKDTAALCDHVIGEIIAHPEIDVSPKLHGQILRALIIFHGRSQKYK